MTSPKPFPKSSSAIRTLLLASTAIALAGTALAQQPPANAPPEEATDVVVVVGAGPIGQLTAQCSKLAGAGVVVVVEPDDRRRAKAAELGADVVLDGGPDTRSEIRALTAGRGADRPARDPAGSGRADRPNRDHARADLGRSQLADGLGE